MKIIVKIIKHILLILLATALLSGIVLLLNSCNVIKGKHTRNADSTRVVHIDSGQVKKNVSSEKTQSGWERQTLLFRDTTINNYIYSGSTAKPQSIDYGRLAAIINERGNYNHEKQNVIYDSSWRHELDSLKAIIKDSAKDKKEKGLPLSAVIGLTALAVLILHWVPNPLSKLFKLIKS